MQSPLPQLTTIFLLTHLGLGCCMHHSHACQLEQDSRPVELLGSLGHAHFDGCANHVHARGAGVAESESFGLLVGIVGEGHHAHECSGADCTFIANRTQLVSDSKKVNDLSSRVVQSLGPSAIAPRDASLAALAAQGLAQTALPRTHLTLQVWQL